VEVEDSNMSMSSNIATLAAATPVPVEMPAWVDSDLYPFAPRRLELSEGAMSYLDEGTGPTVLMVHGTPTWSFEWRKIVFALRDRARCVVPDHLGFGLSDKLDDPDRLHPEDHARRLQTLVEKLDLSEIHLVVHDFGGPIGIAMALAMPEHIKSVTVLNSWMWAHGEDRRIGQMSRLVRSPLGRFAYLWLNASPRWIVPMAFGDKRKLDRDVHRHYLQAQGSRSDRLGPWVLGCDLAGADPFYASLWERREVLERWPLSLVWGMRDPAFGPSYLERWQQAFPAARTIECEGAGHFPQEESPAEVLDAIREHLRRDSPSAPAPRPLSDG
jgi:pimeloyl-ACP methyl ester carboxylesterase